MYYTYSYNDELYHFGVKGMKWGVRKADKASSGSKPRYGTSEYHTAKANKRIAKIGTSKTRLGKVINNNLAYEHEKKANVAKSIEKNGSLLNYADSKFGIGARSSQQKAAANYFDRKAGYAKTRFGKTQSEVNAFNTRNEAKSLDKMRNSKSVKELGTNFVNHIANKPVKTWSGRETTNGRQYVDQLFKAGGLMEDILYYRSGR